MHAIKKTNAKLEIHLFPRNGTHAIAGSLKPVSMIPPGLLALNDYVQNILCFSDCVPLRPLQNGVNPQNGDLKKWKSSMIPENKIILFRGRRGVRLHAIPVPLLHLLLGTQACLEDMLELWSEMWST